MSYLATRDVQAWLQNTKFKISSVDPEFEIAAKAYIFGSLGQRYETDPWVDSTETPTLVMTLLAMQVASYELRRAASEEDGRTTYADYLDKRISYMCTSILSGATILSGGTIVVSDTGLGSGPQFFPAEGDELKDPCDVDYAPRYFSMGQQF